MDNQANVVGARPGDAERPRESDVAALGRGGRMSRQRKTAAVLRLLRGEDLETVSRALGVTAATLTGWDGGLKRLRAGCCPLLPEKSASRCSVSPLTPMMGWPRANPEENRDPSQGISFQNA